MRLVYRQRRLPVLTLGELPCRPQVATLTCLTGCLHGCLECAGPAEAAAEEPTLVVASRALTKLRSELRYRSRRPPVVCLGTAADLFQPHPELHELAFEVLRVLFRLRVGVLLYTKGTIPPRHLELLASHAELVRANVVLSAVDDRLVRLMEPGAPAAGSRLEQLRALRAAGVETEARLEPVVPGLNAADEVWRPLLAAVAQTGVRRATARLVRLRPTSRALLQRRLAEAGAGEAGLVLPGVAPTGGGRRGRLLAAWAREARQALERRLQVLGWEQGLEVRTCRCGDRDRSSGSCLPDDGWPHGPPRLRQLPLFAGPWESARSGGGSQAGSGAGR